MGRRRVNGLNERNRLLAPTMRTERVPVMPSSTRVARLCFRVPKGHYCTFAKSRCNLVSALLCQILAHALGKLLCTVHLFQEIFRQYSSLYLVQVRGDRRVKSREFVKIFLELHRLQAVAQRLS